MDNNKILKFKKLESGIIGIKSPAIEGDAGYDLFSSEDNIVEAKSSKSIHTKVAIELPQGYWFEIMPRSGLATKHNLAVHNGVIDNGYRGEIIIHIYNHGNQDYKISKNDKIAQGVIRKLYNFELKECDELNDSIRGKNGFGSTGK